MNGYILLHKKVMNSDIWSKPPLYFKVFMYLIMRAQFQEYKGLERGQVLTSIPEIQEACSYYVGYRKVVPTKDQIRGVLDYLRSPSQTPTPNTNTKSSTNTPMITTTKTTRGIVVTICNYNVYQDFKYYEAHNEDNNEADNENQYEAHNGAQYEPTHHKEIRYKENKKEDKNKKNIYNPPFIPPTAEEVREYCNERKSNIDPEAFIDFYQTRGWVTGKVKMKDWKAAVRTWERKEKENGNHTGNIKRSGKFDHIGTRL